MKKLISILLLLVMVFCSGYRKPYKYTIDAGKDAFYHNNVGLNYLKDRIYYAAIQQFKIAIQHIESALNKVLNQYPEL